jgi:diketogulonate reductase-like aldo/keto reductase
LSGGKLEMNTIGSLTELNNGVSMPWIGLGVYNSKEGDEVERAVKFAIQAGYRGVDTASLYGNEIGVGKAVRESGVPRNEIFITTKLWNTEQGYEATLKAFERSRSKLGVDYIDLYMIHWAVKDKFKETWNALEKLYNDGLVKAIGVSNFQIHHLEELMTDSKVKPAVNQVELHPLLTQKPLLQFCKANGIQLEAHSPLMRGNNMDSPVFRELSSKYDKSVAQIILRWDLQNGIVVIPKSVSENRIIENSQIFDFELLPEDMAKIDGMNRDHRFGGDPDNVNFDPEDFGDVFYDPQIAY